MSTPSQPHIGPTDRNSTGQTSVVRLASDRRNTLQTCVTPDLHPDGSVHRGHQLRAWGFQEFAAFGAERWGFPPCAVRRSAVRVNTCDRRATGRWCVTWTTDRSDRRSVRLPALCHAEYVGFRSDISLGCQVYCIHNVLLYRGGCVELGDATGLSGSRRIGLRCLSFGPCDDASFLLDYQRYRGVCVCAIFN